MIIGLTGNIATGKSTILRMAAERGACTIDADRVVHELLATDTAVQQAIRERFGDAVFSADHQINRAALGRIVFADPAALRALENLLHPAVGNEIQQRIAATDATIIVLEAIKLLEGSLHTLCDAIWVTTAPPDVQIERLVSRRGMESADAQQRVAAQPPQAEKIARADVVFHTAVPLAELAARFEAVWQQLTTPPFSAESADCEK
jgi:dephospho-CoA kinase